MNNTKLYIKNLEKISKSTNESLIVNSIVYKVLVEEKPLFCQKEFKTLRNAKLNEINVFDILIDLIKAIVYLGCVNFNCKFFFLIVK